MKTFLMTICAALLLMTSNAFAADLKTAKAAGQIGEQRDGYLGLVVNDAPADVKALVDQVNQQRRAHFQDIAEKTKASVEEAARTFAKQAFERTEAGHYIQNDGGQWVKK